MKLFFFNKKCSTILLSFLILLFSSVTWAGAFESGMSAVKRGDYDKAFLFLCFSILEGNKRALYEHSRILYAEGLDNDFTKARKCYLSALKKGMVEATIELGFIDYIGFGSSDPDYLQSYIYYKIVSINQFDYNGLTVRDVVKQLESMKPLLDDRDVKFADKLAGLCYPRQIIPCTIPPKGKKRDQFLNYILKDSKDE